MTDEADLPWLQDTTEASVWRGWGIEYRDVVVLDGQGAVVGIISLTDYDLGDAAAYDALAEQLGVL